MKRCVNCQLSFPDNIAICDKCGSILVEVSAPNKQAKVCRYCGESNNENDTICKKCGNQFSGKQKGAAKSSYEKSKQAVIIVAVIIVVVFVGLVILGSIVGSDDLNTVNSGDINDFVETTVYVSETIAVADNTIISNELFVPSSSLYCDEYEAFVNADFYGYSTVGLFFGPDVDNYDVIGSLPNNKKVTVKTMPINGWCLIETGDYEGWVKYDYIEEVADNSGDQQLDSYNAFNEFYISYLDGINSNNPGKITNCTPAIRNEMAERFEINQKSIFDLKRIDFDNVSYSQYGDRASFYVKCVSQLYNRATNEKKDLNYAVWFVTVEMGSNGEYQVINLERDDRYKMNTDVYTITDKTDIR